MEKRLKTKAAEKFFGNKKTTVKEEIKTGTQYVYEIINQGKHYILKGFIINVVKLESDNPSSKERYLEMIKTIVEICQEYESARLACTFSAHFAKPLILDYEIDTPEHNFPYFVLHIEIVFEYGGVSLDELKGADVNLVYNLMRQSANAISLLHSIGITHLDIKPQNMVYDSKKNLLKVIDMGSSFGYDTIRKTYNPTININNKIRSYTRVYSPPEVLHFVDENLQPNFILGSIDTYSWAMSFYSILLSKNQTDLELEITNFKKDGETTYMNFTSALKKALDKIESKKSEEQKKMKIIKCELLEGLNYRPEKRPTMDKIVDHMRGFENEESIDNPYKNIELENIKRIKKIFKLEKEDNDPNSFEPINRKKIEIELDNEETIRKTSVRIAKTAAVRKDENNKVGTKKGFKSSEEEKEMRLQCYLCKDEIKEGSGYEYNCACGVRIHEVCMNNRFSNKDCPRCNKILIFAKVPPSKKRWILPCCKREIQDKEIYIDKLIELNKEKMISNAERAICPFCSRTLDSTDMKKILTTSEINSILKASSITESKPIKEETKTGVCSKCSAELTKDKEFISFDCGHKYHIICAKGILEGAAYFKKLPKCTAKNCEKSVYNSEGLLRECNEIIAKNCACCGEPGTRFVLLKCKHYVCKKCGENFRNEKNKYLERKGSTLMVDCKICDEKREAISLVLRCQHIIEFSHSRSHAISCERCSYLLDNVELYAVLGKEKVDKEPKEDIKKARRPGTQGISVNPEQAVIFEVK